MEDIELVIKIPERIHYGIEKGITVNGSKASQILIDAVKNGIPLSKGHGRLIDADKVQSMARKKAEDCFPEGRYDYGYRKALFEFAKDIDNAPTIIEADKAESEEI